MMRPIAVHYYHRQKLIEFKCPYCRFLHWSGQWKLIDGKLNPGPRTVFLKHLKRCPDAMVGEKYEFQVVVHPDDSESAVDVGSSQ